MTNTGKRILIVDDQALTALDLQQTLVRLGYAVVGPVATGEEAVRTGTTEHPDLILMDIGLLGKMDGITAAQQIWEKTRIPVIFVTSFSDEATLSRAKLTHPYGYIIKPYDEAELRVNIELALYRHATETSQRHLEQKPVEQMTLLESVPVLSPSPSPLKSPELFLRRVPPFNVLPADEIKQLASSARFITIKHQDFLSVADNSACSPFVVATGRIAVGNAFSDGKELTLALLPPGDIFGVLLALSEEPLRLSMRAQRDSEILLLSRETLNAVLLRHPEVFREFSQLLLEKLQAVNDLALSVGHGRVEQRIAAALDRLMQDFGQLNRERGETCIDITRAELADIAATTPESAIRVTKNMERLGLLDLREPGKIRVIQKEMIERLSMAQDLEEVSVAHR